MKKIAPHINTYCTFCKAAGVEKVRAIWRLSYDLHNRACDAHRPDLEAIETRRREQDNHTSEADEQTWRKL